MEKRSFELEGNAATPHGYAERLIGTLRCECLDQMVIYSEAHLRRILSGYVAYYNQARTHLALEKDAHVMKRAVTGSIIRTSLFLLPSNFVRTPKSNLNCNLISPGRL